MPAGRVGSDTEEVTGSNPVAPTTILPGQGPCQHRADSPPHALRPRCGRRLLPTEPCGPSGVGRHGTTPRPTTTQGGHHLLVQAMVGHHTGDPPRTPYGAGEHLLGPMLPRHPAGTLALDQRPCRPGGAAAGTPDPGLRSTLVPASHSQRSPSLPVRPDAGRRPRRPRTTGAHQPVDPTEGRPATPSHSRSSAARTARRQRRGHRRPVRPDTWMPRTPGHRTPGRWTSARPVGRTDTPLDGRTPPRRDRGRGQGNDRLAGLRTSSPPATPAGRPTSPGGTAPGNPRPPRTARR
jgi:hypothetical protein